MKAVLYFDGSNDPKFIRPASWGYVLEIEGQEVIEGQGLCKQEFNGVPLSQTNNLGEYSALCHGIRRAKLEGVTHISIKGDSQLVVRQITGEYKVNRDKYPHLGILHQAAISILSGFLYWEIEWISQTINKADSVSRVTEGVTGFQRSTKAKGKITRNV
jgi:ribonuclease HI